MVYCLALKIRYLAYERHAYNKKRRERYKHKDGTLLLVSKHSKPDLTLT